MKARLGYWSAGLVLSCAAHAGAGALLLVALQPDPVTDQPSPTSELEVQAYALQRDTAREAEPQAENATEAEAGETALDPGAIPQSRATPIEAPASTALAAASVQTDALDAVTTGGDQLAAQRAEPIPLAPGVAPVETAPAIDPAPASAALAALPDATPALAAAAPAPQSIAPAAPQPLTSAAIAPEVTFSAPVTPASAPLSAAAPEIAPTSAATIAAVAVQTGVARPTKAVAVVQSGAPLAAARPVAPDLPSATPDVAAARVGTAPRTPVSETPPSAERVKATLAFPGGSDAGVDPVSLAAFQSFMQPGDVTASGDTLRDGVSALLSQVPCSRLQVAFDPETATLQVNGHIPDGDLRAPVLAALSAQMGTNIGVSDNILILPRPQCGALSGIANVGLPQSTDQNTNPLLIGNDTQARVFDFIKDDPLSFDITGPDYPAYVYVDFFDAGGNVVHLAPNDQVALQKIEADAPYRIGARNPGDPGLQIRIGPPYGQEIAVAFAASEPLYDGLRPIIEPAAPYLEWLQSRVAEARAQNPDFKGEWVYFFVSTTED